MADGYYRFTFADQTNADLSISYSNSASGPWTSYQPPAKTLKVNTGDTIYIQLAGPANWVLNGRVQVIISRSAGAASRQAYSPFSGSVVWMNPTGQNTNNVWQGMLGSAVANPGTGKSNGFEITVAFNAQLPTSGQQYFAVDPEMDVQGM